MQEIIIETMYLMREICPVLVAYFTYKSFKERRANRQLKNNDEA